MSDALPLPPRPNLDQYRTLARDLQRVARASASDPGAFRQWASRWLDTLAHRRGPAVPSDASDPSAALAPELAGLDRRWREFVHSPARAAAFKLTDAQFFVARQHGFASWPAFAAHLEGLALDSSPVALFESAVDAIVAGDATTLRRLLQAHPELARARSTRDHRSTLLHYVSANGVEDFRQMTPPNIVSMAEMLIAAGADVNAASDAYGGGSTTLGLVATSVHPEQAGVQMALLESLLTHGATIEGEQAGNRHGIVLGCLANGQPRAARFFAERGAPLNLVEASGVGLLDRVRAFFSAADDAPDALTSGDLDAAVQYAAGYGHADVVRFLLEHGADAGKAFRADPDLMRALGLEPAPAESAVAAHSSVSVTHLEITTAEINLCSLSVDGRQVLTASQGNPVTIYDARTGARHRALDSSTVNAWLARWTANPSLVIAGSRDQSIDVWDIDRGERVCVLRGHHGQPRAADTNAEVTRALTGCSFRDTTVKLWDLSTGACLRTLHGHTDGVYAIAFHGDHRAATGSRDTTIRLWDLGAGQTLRVLTGHTYHVHSVAWSGDGRRLLSCSMDARLWDTDTGRCLRVFEGHTEVIRSVVWSPDESHVLSASHDRTARLWNVARGHCDRLFEGHAAGLVSAAFSADGRHIFTCDWLGEIRSWAM